MLILQLKGTPQEVGHQYGEACRDEFQRLSALARETASRDERWFSDIHLMQSSIAELFPRVLQEMAGMAQGANLSLDDVLLNHRLFLSVGTLYRPCCTNIAFLDPEAPLFGKNLDLEPNPDRQCAIRDVTYEDGLRIVHAVVVGELTARDTCMNGSGLTFGGSSVGSVFEQTLQNPPIEAGLYAMLCSCQTTPEAITFMRKHAWVGKGYNFVVLDANGEGAVLECACPLVQVRRPQNGEDAVFCANTYKLPALLNADLRTPQGKEYSELRYAYLQHKLFQEHVPHTIAQMQALLSSYGPKGGLCRPIDEGDTSKTRMSIIAEPAKRRFRVADGRPCDATYVPVW